MTETFMLLGEEGVFASPSKLGLFNAKHLPKPLSRDLVSIEVLGLQVLIACANKLQAEEVRFLLNGLCCELNRSPDIVLSIPSSFPLQFLYRIPPRETASSFNVHWTEHPHEGENLWNGLLPLVPPFGSQQLSNRYIALHAASLSILENSALVIAGDQNTGKTTGTVLSQSIDGLSVLSEETTFVDTICLNSHYFITAPRIWQNGSKIAVAASAHYRRPKANFAPIKTVITLRRCSAEANPSTEEVVSPAAKLVALLPFLRNVGNSSWMEIVALGRLAQKVRLLSVSMRLPRDLEFYQNTIKAVVNEEARSSR